MRQIEVLQPRAIIIGKTVLFPGVNDITPTLEKLIKGRKATQKLLAKLERANVVRLKTKADTEGQRFDASDSLAGLEDAVALQLIDQESDRARLGKWKKKAKPELKAAIEDRIAYLDLEAEGK